MISPPHPLFRAFDEFDGLAAPGFETSYFGRNSATGFHRPIYRHRPERPHSRGLSAGCRGILRVDRHARRRGFRQRPVLHVGIGRRLGRWSVYAAMLCRQRRLPFTLVAVEPEPSHFNGCRWSFRTTESTRAITTSTKPRWSPAARWRAGRHRRSAPRVRTLCKLGIEKLAAHPPRRHAVREVKGVSLREILLAHPT